MEAFESMDILSVEIETELNIGVIAINGPDY